MSDKSEKLQKAEATISQLKAIREGVPQILFVDEIRHRSTLALRLAILNYKLKGGDSKEVDFIIQSPGGIPDEAYRIIRTLRKNFDEVNIIVPFWAKSAATLLALGGTKIVMDEFGEFGPLDAQMGKVRDDSPDLDWESALNDEQSVQIVEYHFKTMYESMFLQIYEHDRINISKNELSKQLLDNLSRFYEPLLKQIDPYRLGDKRRTLDIGTHYAQRILSQYGKISTEDDMRKVTDFLVDGCPDHGYVIDYDIMKILLPNAVITPIEFAGSDYEQMLSLLSNQFISGEFRNLKFVGFVCQDDDKSDDVEETADIDSPDLAAEENQISELENSIEQNEVTDENHQENTTAQTNINENSLVNNDDSSNFAGETPSGSETNTDSLIE